MNKRFAYSFIYFTILLSNFYAILAWGMTCPIDKEVKGVVLIQAVQDKYDPECWNFISNNFTHDGVEWNVSFGTFLPNAQTSEEALQQGQAFFDNAPLQIKHPKPVNIPGKTLCDYMPEGEEYWISAVSPPETMPTNFKKK